MDSNMESNLDSNMDRTMQEIFQLKYVVPVGIAIFVIFIYKWLFPSTNGYWEKQGVKEVNLSTLHRIYNFFKKPFHEVEIGKYKKYGRLFGSFEGKTPVLVVGDPDYLRLILSKDFNIFPNRRNFRLSSKLFEKVLTALEGEDWKRVRSIVSPTFSTGRIKKMSSLVEECIKSLMANMESNNDQTVDIKKYFGAYTMDVISSCAFGIKVDSHNDPNNSFVTAARQIFNRNASLKMILLFLFPKKLLKFFNITLSTSQAAVFFAQVTQDIITKRKMEKMGEEKHDFLQLMLDAQNESNEKTITEDEMMAQCVLFFLAGYDTTANTLSYTAYNLALNPDVQTLLQKEIDNAWDEAKGQPDFEKIMSLPYLDAALSETLRLHPIASRIERVSIKDYTLDNKIKIPKGTVIGVPICGIHHDEEFFPDPWKYKPERFLGENKDKINPYSYIPFGSGPRNCVGLRFALMEAKFAMVNVIHKFEFVATSETREDLTFYIGNGLLQAHKVPVKVVRRTK